MSIRDLLTGMRAFGKANPRYDTAEEYYEGTRPEFFASNRLRRALMQTGVTYRTNFAKVPINAMASRLELTGISGQDDTTTKLIEDVWNSNRMDLESPNIHRRACEFGDAYVLVWPSPLAEEDVSDDVEDTGVIGGGTGYSYVVTGTNIQRPPADLNALAPEGGEEPGEEIGVDIFYNDPRTMRVLYDDENPRQKAFAIKAWKDTDVKDSQTRVNLYYADRIEKYISKRNGKIDEPAGWEEFDDGTGAWPLDNPYGEVPVFHFRTDMPYGTPIHKDAYGPQDIITKIVITHMNTMDYHGAPQRWALSDNDMAEGDDDMEDFSFADDQSVASDPAIQAGDTTQQRAQVKADPGTIWFLRGIKSVGQFPAAPPNTFLEPLAIYVRIMAQLCDTPLHYFDPMGDSPSGESLRVAEGPLVKKALGLQEAFGATWEDVAEFVLKIKGIDEKPETAYTSTENVAQGQPANEDDQGSTTANWKTPAINNDIMAWDLAILKRDTGVPIREVLSEMGYSRKQMDEWGVPASKWVEPPAPAAPLANLPPVRVNPLSPGTNIG